MYIDIGQKGEYTKNIEQPIAQYNATEDAHNCKWGILEQFKD